MARLILTRTLLQTLYSTFGAYPVKQKVQPHAA